MSGSAAAWTWLMVAGLLEIGFAMSMKLSEGFSRLWPTLSFVLFAIASLYCLERATRSLPVGLSYAVWTGIGAGGTVLAGALWFRESLSALQYVFLAGLIGCVAGLKFASNH